MPLLNLAGRSSAPVRAALIGAGLAVVAPAALPLTAALHAQWPPDRFQFWCGTAFVYSEEQRAENESRAPGWLGGLDVKDYRVYLNNLGTELDRPAPGCLDSGRLDEMEDMAAHALRGLASYSFQSPAPVRLGPVILDEQDRQAARIYADPTFTRIGETYLGAWSTGPVPPNNVAHVRFSIAELASLPAWSRYRIIAHELVHVVQSAQGFRTDASVDGNPIRWIYDGTADALAAEMTRRRGYGLQLPLSVRGSRSVYGLRTYDRSLTWDSGTERGRYGNVLITGYTASSLWTYLAERFFNGSFDYLGNWFAFPDSRQGEDDWLRWVDELMRWDAGGVDHPLYLVFPDFIAHYAAWGEKKYPHIGEEDWHAEVFDGCETVTLSPGDPPAELTFEMEPISARCVKVLVGNVPANEAVAVELMAYDSDTDRLDNLHLTASRMSSTVGGVTFDCYDEAARTGPTTLCLHKPFTGAKGRALAPSDSGGVTAGGGGDYVKTWLGVEQIPAEGLIENTYFVVHTPVEPRDAEHDVHQGGRPQSVRLEIGLERTKVALFDGASTGTASVNGTAGLGLVPMRGGDAGGGGGALDLPGAIASAMESATDPDAMSRSLFLQNNPLGTVIPGPGGDCEGICMVTLEQKEVRPDGYGGYELATVGAVSLTPEQPIPFGGTGSFKAMVSGCPGESCEEGIGVGEGTVSVLRFDDEVLHLSVSGSYCVFSGLASLLCPDPRTFQGEVVKPFGWAYDGSRTFHSIDTPGMAEYREHLSKALAGMMPGTVTAWRKQQDGPPGEDPVPAGETTGDPAAGGGGGGGVVAPACDCSCDGYRTLMAAVEAYQARLQAAASAGEPPPPQPPAMRSFMRCSMQCAVQWGSCGASTPTPSVSRTPARAPPPARPPTRPPPSPGRPPSS